MVVQTPQIFDRGKIYLKECPAGLNLADKKTGFFASFRILIVGACSCGFIKTNQINLKF